METRLRSLVFRPLRSPYRIEQCCACTVLPPLERFLRDESRTGAAQPFVCRNLFVDRLGVNSGMELLQLAIISPPAKQESGWGTQIDRRQELSLFEAVRRWTDDEGNPFEIDVDGNRLTVEQIQELLIRSPTKNCS